jgi:hypothetical protein
LAAAKSPVGSKSDKLWRDAIMRAVRRLQSGEGNPQALDLLADKTVSMGIGGDMAAIKEIGDRLDGRPAQTVGVGQAPDLDPIETITRPPITREEWLAIHQTKPE